MEPCPVDSLIADCGKFEIDATSFYPHLIYKKHEYGMWVNCHEVLLSELLK